MSSWMALLAGFSFTFGVGFCVKPLLSTLRDRMPISPVSGSDRDNALWLKLQKHPDESGVWVGISERIILFGAVLVGSWEGVGIWLAFKVAAKWEAWNHMGFVPENPSLENNTQSTAANAQPIHPLEWACARRIWAAQGYATFVVGTAMNLVLASVGVLIVKFGRSGWDLNSLLSILVPKS